MKRSRLGLRVGIAILAAGLVGCAGVEGTHDKPGVSDAQRQQDRAACMRSAVERIPGGPTGDIHFTVERVDPACMEAKGYRLK